MGLPDRDGTEKRLHVEDYHLGGNFLEAYYFEDEGRRAMAIDTDDDSRRRMWELVAHGMGYVPEAIQRLLGNTDPRVSGCFFFGESEGRRTNALAVHALSKALSEMEPGWIAAVEDARRLADKVEVVSA